MNREQFIAAFNQFLFDFLNFKHFAHNDVIRLFLSWHTLKPFTDHDKFFLIRLFDTCNFLTSDQFEERVESLLLALLIFILKAKLLSRDEIQKCFDFLPRAKRNLMLNLILNNFDEYHYKYKEYDDICEKLCCILKIHNNKHKISKIDVKDENECSLIDVKSILRMKFDMNEEECEEESSESYSYVYYDIEYEYEYTEEECEEEYEYIEYEYIEEEEDIMIKEN